MALILDRTMPLDEILACAKEVYELQDQTQQHQMEEQARQQQRLQTEQIEKNRCAFIEHLTELFVKATGLEPIIAAADIHLDGHGQAISWEMLPGLTLRINETKQCTDSVRGLTAGSVFALITYNLETQKDVIIANLGDLGRAVARISRHQQREDDVAAKKAALQVLEETAPVPPAASTIFSECLHGGLRLIPRLYGLDIYPYLTRYFSYEDTTGTALGFRFKRESAVAFCLALDEGEGTITVESELDLVIVQESTLEWVLLPRASYEADELPGVTMRQVYAPEHVVQLRDAIQAWLAYQVQLEALNQAVLTAQQTLREVLKTSIVDVG